MIATVIEFGDNMNRRNFIKLSATISAAPSLLLANKQNIEQPKPTSYYQVRCYVWDYASNSRKEYDDLWTFPEPWFGNLDSATKFIEDHISSFDLSLVNVMYDVKYITPGVHYTVASYSYNSSGLYHWIDYPPHQRYDHDIA